MFNSGHIGHRFLTGVFIGGTALTMASCRTVYTSLGGTPPLPPTLEVIDIAPVGETPEETTESSRWPKRWGDNPAQRGVIIELDRPWSQFRSAHLGRQANMRSSEIEYSDAEVLAGELGMESGFRFKPEGPGSFLFLPRIGPIEEMDTKPEPEMAFKFVSARKIEFPGEAEENSVRLERTWFTFRTPEPGDGYTGTIVILPGMFGTPEPVIDGLESFMLSRGWSTLRMMSHPSGFTAHKVVPVKMETAFARAKEIAQEYDQRTAECAYATQAALEHVRAASEITDAPIVLLGMSGGAMVLPAVYALDPDSYDAAVLIAGGANSMLITAMSNYKEMIDAVRLDYDPTTPEIDGEPTRELLKALSTGYRANARLDATHTAKEVRGIPVLQLHATRDKAVPAKSGDALYEALAKPERWTYPVGHELIFAALPMQVGKINAWLMDQLGLTPVQDPQP